MGNYIAQKDLVKAFDENDFPRDENGNSDACRIDESIQFAEMTADSYVRSAGIATPVDYDQGISQLRGPVLDIAWYRLQDHPSETVKERYEQAIAWLEKLAKGVVKLPANPAAPAGEQASTGKAYGLSTIRMVRG